ncbi:MAG: matrixin family metalloprotease [Polyangiaceae bacterium]
MVLAALALVPSQEKPALHPHIVSGSAQVRYTEDGIPERWGSTQLTLQIDPTLKRLDPNAADAVARSVEAWQGLENLPRVDVMSLAGSSDEDDDAPAKLEESELVPDGKNTISYRRLNIPGHRKDLAITVTYANPRTGEIVEADMYVNARRDFGLLARDIEATPSCSGSVSGRCDQRFDLQSVVTHELGHLFGLGEDLEDPLSTMYLCTSPCETHKRVLSEPDHLSATELYLAEIPAEEQGVSCSMGRHAVPPLRAVAWLLLGASGLLLHRRSRLRA